ncbi:hypothetical protein [Actinomyces israelii]|uniref:Uncharacterized protein n=1 Tax=Actinomyces israelii TaxID=1659 RepID=A0ABT4ICY0_9ACTO|nr:hypothetical protein [Actinomyces israelii]MCZ0859598.1 hypothetical protein [Actinomyces israelii]WKR20247.1 hypothetical protein AIF0345_0116 [Actinomyces israelii]
MRLLRCVRVVPVLRGLLVVPVLRGLLLVPVLRRVRLDVVLLTPSRRRAGGAMPSARRRPRHREPT